MIKFLIIFTTTFILKRVFCIETISTLTSQIEQGAIIELNIGSPPVLLTLLVTFGTKTDSVLGQFIIDESLGRSSNYINILQQLGINNVYSYEKSQTSLIKDPFQREDAYYYTQIAGVEVEDVLSFKNIKLKSKYKFDCVQQFNNMVKIYFNGVIIFDRLQENIFDQMYEQNVIKTSDYILRGEIVTEDLGYTKLKKKKINMSFDLDAKSEYYNTPSNPMVSNTKSFQIMSYGIYLNGEDISEEIKNKRIILDQLTDKMGYLEDTTYIPKDLYKLILKDYNIDQYNQFFQNCKNCQCEEVKNLPDITLITEQYKITITPEHYTSYNGYSCFIYLYEDDNFVISAPLLFKLNNQIMYQKQSNSVKIIGAQLINHMNLKSIIITFSIFSGLNLIILIIFSSKFLFSFKPNKLEETFLKSKKQKKIAIEMNKIK